MENEAIDTFIIESVLIDPIHDIISKLERNQFRDCDVIWLDSKIKNFTDFAAETLKVRAPVVFPREQVSILNEYTKVRFIKTFTTLLNYFKSF